MTEKQPIVFRYTPHNEGDFIKGIPPRDLTQADVDRIHPTVRNDAFQPHPLHGTPLYTAVDAGEDETPKWYLAKVEKAKEDGTTIPPMLLKETQRAYEERTAAPVDDEDATDGDTGPDKEGD